MKYNTFKELYKDVSILGDQGKSSEALNLFIKALENLPQLEYEKHYSEIQFTKATLSYECGLHKEYIQILTETIDGGFAYPQKYLHSMPVSSVGFTTLQEKNQLLLAQAQQQTEFQFEAHLPMCFDKTKPYPLFLALHGNGGNIQELGEYWTPKLFTDKGFIFVYAQSSQVWWHNGYGWTQNLSVARQDIQQCYQFVAERYSIDEECILIGGFSGGAIASLEVILADVFPVKGFILLCPGANPESLSGEKVTFAAQRGVRGVLMEGEILAPVPAQEIMMSLFREAGLQHKYIINKGIGHWFPDDLTEKLKQGLDFILDSGT